MKKVTAYVSTKGSTFPTAEQAATEDLYELFDKKSKRGTPIQVSVVRLIIEDRQKIRAIFDELDELLTPELHP